ncbi:TspO/MBR family protein [uncultured Friedmanniella sp.]|uniref:TspO/MBR family protein n=1 Tax=uncultured Friedmanniella sp. TaxID=335381 RepID=UPI0035CC9BF6
MTTKDTLGSVAGVLGTAVVGSVASRDVRSPWYLALRRPAIQPPGPVFGIVWSVLYTDIAATSAVVLDRLGRTDPAAADAYRRALAVNLVLNASWSWVFFKGHQLVPAVAVAGVLAASSVDLARRASAATPAAAGSLSVYAAWCSFATVLSAAIWRRNR